MQKTKNKKRKVITIDVGNQTATEAMKTTALNVAILAVQKALIAKYGETSATVMVQANYASITSVLATS